MLVHTILLLLKDDLQPIEGRTIPLETLIPITTQVTQVIMPQDNSLLTILGTSIRIRLSTIFIPPPVIIPIRPLIPKDTMRR
jgi:hypothetical protein